MIWDQLTSYQLDKIGRNTPVILVMSATEQHGPHLPLATDRLIGEHFAHSLHESLPDKVLVLPPVNIGCSEHHMDFPGSLSVSHKTFSFQVQDLVRSVIHHGFGKIILLNSHGGNQAIGQVLLEDLGSKYPLAHIILATWWQIAAKELQNICESGFGGVGHACEFETSLMMLIAPHLVIKKNIPTDKNIKATFPWAESDMLHAPKASYFRKIKEISEIGVVGDPSTASKEKGKLITDAVVKALIELATDLLNHQSSENAINEIEENEAK